MKRIAPIIIFMVLISCQKRQDLVFSASDELHILNLYKYGSEFEMLYNGVNWAEGTFKLRNDTVFVKYNSVDNNKVLVRRILIDRKANRVKSIDGVNFCASICIDKLKKSDY